MRQPLAPGTKVGYYDMVGFVVEDFGGETLKVRSSESDEIQTWYWEFEGVVCVVISEFHQEPELDILRRKLTALQEEFRRINVQDPELMEKVRGYANAEHGLVVDMDDDSGRTGLYIETGFLRKLLDRNKELEDGCIPTTRVTTDRTRTATIDGCEEIFESYRCGRCSSDFILNRPAVFCPSCGSVFTEFDDVSV